MKHIAIFIASLSLVINVYCQSPAVFTVKANQLIAPIQPTMWGIFFEDINFAADGGIYAELVKNRSFEFYKSLMGWREDSSSRYSNNSRSGYTTIINRSKDNPSNPRFARINVLADKGYGLTNEGFRGMGLKKGMTYHFSILASQHDGSNTKIRIELKDSKGNLIGNAAVNPSGKEWKKYTAEIVSSATDAKGALTVWFEGKGTLDIDMVSLFPGDTWKNRPGGLRADLVQLLVDMKPGFIRFPGGCIVEGHELATRYQWKKTVGDVNDREMIINRWNREFDHRPASDYFQSFGLGFFEYFQLSEDVGAEPLPILNCGMACQFNSAELVPLDELDPYIQDALDLIEFANGSVETKWGKLRTDMGHPAPFNLKMMGVGNEQWGPQYVERYKIFAKAIHEKYPDIKLISSVGPFASGELFGFLDKEMREMKADILDEHYYMPPDFFLSNAKRYDNYDRNGPKIFAGEYASHIRGTEGIKRNTWQAALSEAAFMTGLERNADVVFMCSYAPLFSHVDAWQWAPDLIWFDNLNSYGTPNYYVQKLFSVNKGTHVVPVLLNNEAITGQDSLYATACIDKNTNELIVKIVNVSSVGKSRDLLIEGVKKLNKKAAMIVLKSDNPNQLNSIDTPQAIAPLETVIDIPGRKVKIDIAAYSVTVFKMKM
jgi:alpha-L-arabinofuranosidase